MDFATDITLTPALKDFISGAVAGAFAITVSQPLDTVRVRLQQAAQGSGPARNALSVLTMMVRREGVLSPFKGLTYPLLFASVQSAILFQAYGWTLRQLASQQQEQQPQPAPSAASSSFAGLSSPRQQLSVATSPTSTISSPSAVSPLSPAASSSALHQLHLHHHHHQQDQQAAGVHGSTSLSGQVLAWAAARLAGAGPAGPSSSSSSSAPEAQFGGSGAAEAGPGPGPVSSGGPSLGCHTVCGDHSDGGGGGGRGCTSCSGAAEAGEGSRSGGAGAGRGAESGTGAATAGESSRPLQQQQQQRQGRQQPGHQEGHGQQAALPTPWHGFVAGSVSGFAQVFLWSPVELLKLRAQLQTATPGSAGYRNPAALAKHVLRQDGIAGLYRGFTLTVIRDVPSYAMYFWLYHDIAGALSPGVHPEQAPPATQVLAGGLAGVIAWLPIYPLDVLKTRVQAVSCSASEGKTWLHFAREMYKEAGARAFFRGVAPTLVRAFMMDGASFLGYTTTLKMLGGSGGGREAVAAAAAPVSTPAPAPAPA